MQQSESSPGELPPPPSNLRAEQAILGALLTRNSTYDQVAGLLRPHHFADPTHERIYATISRRLDAGQYVDPITLCGEFNDADDESGAAYVTRLLSAAVTLHGIDEYGRVVRDAWIRRRLIAAAQQIAVRAQSPAAEMDAASQLEAADRDLTFITADGAADDDPGVLVADAVQQAVEEGDRARRGDETGAVSSGLPHLDRMMLGLRPGYLYVFGGRPGMGKTALGRSIALNVAGGLGAAQFPDGTVADDPERGGLVAYFSTEEEPPDFGAAILAQLAGVSIGEVLQGACDAQGYSRVVAAQRRLAQVPLVIYRTPRPSLTHIARKCRQIQRKRKQPLRLVVVDYLQRMADPVGIKDKRLAVSDNADGLKDLAKETHCPVIALSQINRAVESRDDKRPTMSDLMESGGIEAAADVIGLLYREAYYALKSRPSRDGTEDFTYDDRLAEWQDNFNRIETRAELRLMKIRRAQAPRLLELHFDGRRTRFTDLPGGPV